MEVRNETIVKLLETLGGIIENRHTGITTMQKKMQIAKLPEPVFTNEREDFVVTFYNGEYPELYPNELNIKEKAQDKKAQDKDVQENILLFCKEERTVFEIMEYVGYKNRTRFRRDYIKPMVESGQLKMTIPDKPTSKNQKYINALD